MTQHEIRAQFLEFFTDRGHAALPSASLVPENDPTTLFTNSGVHPLVPFILAGSHPSGSRLVSVQKCFRTIDIEEVGDSHHHTFFEMMGNWSIGDYFKKEAIEWSFEFLTEVIGLDPTRIYVSVFEGDDDALRDEDSAAIWRETFKRQGIDAEAGERIYFYPKSENWWGPAGKTGPCGPDTEIFYNTGREHDPAFGEVCGPACGCGKYLELWNNVFMEFSMDEDGNLTPLKQKNVDTGMGFERLMRVVDGVYDNYETQLFVPIMERIETLAAEEIRDDNRRHARILADHVRGSVFLLTDGVRPGKAERGSILRRIIRRAIRHGRFLDLPGNFVTELGDVVVSQYGPSYPELGSSGEEIRAVLTSEEERFRDTLERGLNYFEELVENQEIQQKKRISGKAAFDLYQSYGLPIELTEESAHDYGLEVDKAGFEAALEKHREISRAGAEEKFAGGLADHSEETTRLHTATHLLHQALREIIGEHAHQTGSNITRERLRFDFNYSDAMTDEELEAVEARVNELIQADLPVHFETVTIQEAEERGAVGLFADKYGDKVKIYAIGDPADPYSLEFCGGPHVDRTGEIGGVTITKEKSAGSGVRRIYAELKDESS